ncbi:MAG TPA: CheR family methyltransferase, partial [Edaphobacter sp.]
MKKSRNGINPDLVGDGAQPSIEPSIQAPETSDQGTEYKTDATSPIEPGDKSTQETSSQTTVPRSVPVIPQAALVKADPEPIISENGEARDGSPALPFLVVAFGASAGGLQALREVLTTMPPDTGMAFVLITHLSPDHKSYMTEILGRCTSMPVLSIEDGLKPEPNHLYVLPPNFDATLEDGRFHLEQRPPSPRPHLPIDIFFRSLAADQKHFAIGVVLSGADSDGALGLKTIKGEGGIALVQSPETAEHSSMPSNSIAADHVDLVLPPADIARELARVAQHIDWPVVRQLDEADTVDAEEPYFARILQLLRGVSGLEYRLYKEQTLRRRVARRMILLRMENLTEYSRYLQARPDELRTLQEDVLINVTRFFRDPDLWESLKTNIFPSLLHGRSPEKPLRLWCAGCSTGEETYSLAIAVLEFLTANHLETAVQIFGTDASDRSIEAARAAIYPETIAADVSPERLRRFFVKVERGYQIAKRVRDVCIFARQNLSLDPPFSHIDILSCRNVMIYFKQALQRRVIATFHYALEPGGYLLLGMSESMREYGGTFAAADRKSKIYTKVGNGSLLSSGDTEYVTPARVSVPPVLEEHLPLRGWPDLDLQRAADRIVLARFTPPGLIIDEQLNVLQVRGQTASFIQLPAGSVTWNLLRLLREEVAHQVRGPIERAIRDNVPVIIENVTTREGSAEVEIQVDVLPITALATRTRYFLILFQAARSHTHLPQLPSLPLLSPTESESLSVQLRRDLESTRLHLQSLVEERDIHNQELVSANEEIQSANEELQSSNEELETTKEELQSSNEELQTVNEELQQRNLVLLQTGNDLSNLLTSVNIP